MANLDFPPIGDLVLSPHDKVYAPDGTAKRDLLDVTDGLAVDEGLLRYTQGMI